MHTPPEIRHVQSFSGCEDRPYHTVIHLDSGLPREEQLEAHLRALQNAIPADYLAGIIAAEECVVCLNIGAFADGMAFGLCLSVNEIDIIRTYGVPCVLTFYPCQKDGSND